MASACICVPVAEVKAEDGYNIDSYDNDDWYDSDDSPTDMVLDLSNVTIDKTSQPKRMQEKFYDCSSLVWKSYHKNGVNIMHRLQRIWENGAYSIRNLSAEV